MKKILILLIFFCFSINTLFSQKNIKVEYFQYYKHHLTPRPYSQKAYLTISPESSLYEIDIKGQKKVEREYKTEKGTTRVIQLKSNKLFYKDLVDMTIVTPERIRFKEFIVRDSLNIFKWELTNKSKEILGYKCQEAKLLYKGRNYIAFFTSEIPNQNGPWKFHGLPGLILEIRTKDDEMEFKVNVTKITLNSEEIKLVDPFFNQNDKILSRDDYEKLYIKKYNQIVNSQGDEDGFNFVQKMSKGRIEIVVKD